MFTRPNGSHAALIRHFAEINEIRIEGFIAIGSIDPFHMCE
jgi:hypothetical protein